VTGRWVRVIAYVGLLAVAAGAWVTRHAVAAEDPRDPIELTRDMRPLADLLAERARVDVNGEHLWVASAISTLPVRDILERFESACREQGARGTTWGSGSEHDAPDERLSLNKLLDTDVIRSERGDEGALICFPHEGSNTSHANRLAEFLRTKDIGRLGRIRYTSVRHHGDQSHVQTFWTDGALRLDHLVGMGPAEPGFDNPDLPRPIRSRRTLSTAVDGTPYGARGYISTAKPEEVLTAFRQEMLERGWKGTGTADPLTMGYAKDGSLVTIRAVETAEGTVIGIGEMGIDPRVSAPATGARVEEETTR